VVGQGGPAQKLGLPLRACPKTINRLLYVLSIFWQGAREGGGGKDRECKQVTRYTSEFLGPRLQAADRDFCQPRGFFQPHSAVLSRNFFGIERSLAV